MIEHYLNVDSNRVDARVAYDLPGTVDHRDVPNEIQWMPPGQHRITASRGGKPTTLTLNVTEASALRVSQALADFLTAATRGEGDRPYFDFNHDDQEASAHPSSFYWGGSDPQRGGIRARVQWTASGKSAVTGRTYLRFSPSFYPNEQTGEILSAPVNMGGLVNRAAFQKIAPIVSKQAEFIALAGPQDFFSKAKVVAKARNLDIGEAVDVLAHERPEFYDEYRASLGLGSTWERRKETECSKARRMSDGDQLMINARALADAVGIDLVDAISEIAHSQPTLYTRYRARLLGEDLALDPVVIADVHARAELSPFFLKAKQIAKERSVDITNAFDVVATENPELYEAYRESL